MSLKRWFLNAPTWAITNFDAIRTAAIAAKVTLVNASLKLDQETEAAGKPAEVLDPKYVANVLKPAKLAPTYSEIAEVRNRLQSFYAAQNQARVAAGQAPEPMPTSAALEAQARQIVQDTIAGKGGVNSGRAAFALNPEGEGVVNTPSTEDQPPASNTEDEGEGEVTHLN